MSDWDAAVAALARAEAPWISGLIPETAQRFAAILDALSPDDARAIARALPGTLDAAWREAEAALPDGWHNGPTSSLFGYDVMDGGRAYIASVEQPRVFGHRRSRVMGEGPTASAALLALAEKLRAAK